MRYPDCQRDGRSCEGCSLSSYNRDCHNNPINQLAYLRTVAGLTQGQLAESSGIIQGNLSRLETGGRNIGSVSLRVATRIAAALGVHAEDLMDAPD